MRYASRLAAAFFCLPMWATGSVLAQGNVAEGFTRLPAGARIVIMPADIELFEVSMGGVLEPRADWTSDAARHVYEGLHARHAKLGARVSELADDGDEAILALSSLHGAVSRAILVHHFGGLKLPTKEGKLDWTLGPDAAVLQQKTGADYALFTWIRDSYTSEARQAAMVVGALFGVAMAAGGAQHAYASLVDLKTGRIVWFNRVARASGDLRERDKAEETLDVLLTGYPR